MKLNALLDVNVVAHETTDEVAVLLDLEAPTVASDVQRPPSSLQVVLDRSGSMEGPPLEGAKQALVALIHRLDPTDNFGLVTFDNEAQLVVPAGPLTDKAAVIDQIRSVHSGGSTDLGSGYLRGLRELRRVLSTGSNGGQAGGTLLVISDGHVNSGITDVDQFASMTSKAYADGVVTSTLGYGHGYDETLLAAIARSGSGNHVFAADPDAAGAAIAQEVDGLLDKMVQAATLTVHCESAVQMLRLFNDLPAKQIGEGQVMIELGDLYSQEQRKLLMKFQVPAMAALGLAQVATLELQYVELPGLVEHTVKLPISVNVVPGDEASQRIPHPSVRSEVLFQEAQDSKNRASRAFESGDVDAGQALLSQTDAALDAALAIAPADVADSIRAEKEDVARMNKMGWSVGSAHMSKMTRDSYHRQNRKRGRQPGPDEAK
jgi:Ca-activated chloride channel family protein